MKEITAYIQKKYSAKVARTLLQGQFHKLVITNISILGKRSELKKNNYSVEFVRKYAKMVKLELKCREKDMPEVIRIIKQQAGISNHADGIIFGAPMSHSIKVHFDENGRQILKV